MKKQLLLSLSLLMLSITWSFGQTNEDVPQNSTQEQTEEKDQALEFSEVEEDAALTETETEIEAEKEPKVKYTYAYVLVDGKIGRRVKVHIDTGDKPFPVPNKEDAIKTLRKKRSYVAVVNFMIEHGYEVVSINQAYEMAAGNAGIEGLSCVMRKPLETDNEETKENSGLTMNNSKEASSTESAEVEQK
jgi:hypothetical protein